MNNKKWIFVFPLAFLVATTIGCSTNAAPGLKGRWQPVNRFAEAAEAIPIAKSNIFYVAPVDATLKTLLERWAKESEKKLSYQHPNDFTLHAQVAGIRTADLSLALVALDTAYAGHEISIAIEGQSIVVRQRLSNQIEHDP